MDVRHSPPPGCWPVQSPAWLLVAAKGLGLLWLGLVISWLASGGAGLYSLMDAFQILLVFASGVLFWSLWRRHAMPHGAICWTGEHWYWKPAPPADGAVSAGGVGGTRVQLALVWDLQHALVLRLQGARRQTQWICLGRLESQAEWLALRRTLHWHDRVGALGTFNPVPVAAESQQR